MGLNRCIQNVLHVVPRAVAVTATAVAGFLAAGPALAGPDEPPALYEFAGAAAGDNLGASIAGIGDLQRDLYDDFAIGSWLNDDAGIDAGRVDIISGRDRHTILSLYGENPGDAFGFGLAGVGDVDGDDIPDIAIGAHFHDANGDDSGRVYVISGRTGETIVTFDGERAGDRFGRHIAPAGDVDGDRLADIVVGSNYADFNGNDSGSAYVFSCANGGRRLYRFDGAHGQASFARVVDGGHDVDRDGVPDILVGEPQNRKYFLYGGAAYIYSGATGDLLYAVYGDEANERFGRYACLMPDINNDGHAEFLVGAPEHSNPGERAGRVTVYSGIDGAELVTIEGEAKWDAFGKWIDEAGDFNGDEVADFTVGARDSSVNGNGAGRAYVFSGADFSTLLVVDGEAPGDQLGRSVAGVGDINGDGAADVMFGADLADLNGVDSGAAYAYLGSAAPKEYRLTVRGHVAGQQALYRITGAPPGSFNYLHYTFWGMGHTPIPQLAVNLDLSLPVLMAPVVANAEGVAELNVKIPLRARFFFIFYQAARYGEVTNVICRLVR